MNIFNRHRNHKKKNKNIFDDETNGRVQFNIKLDKEIKDAVKEIAKKFRLNQSVVAEHLLQTGLYFTVIAIKDTKKRERIEQHLIAGHLLDKPVEDEEEVIRLVESNQNWMLLAHSKQVVAGASRLNNVLAQVRRTGDFSLAERAEEEWRMDVLKFADYLLKHRFENIEDHLAE